MISDRTRYLGDRDAGPSAVILQKTEIGLLTALVPCNHGDSKERIPWTAREGGRICAMGLGRPVIQKPVPSGCRDNPTTTEIGESNGLPFSQLPWRESPSLLP